MRKVVAVIILGLLISLSSFAQERTATVIQARAYLRPMPAVTAGRVKKLKKGVTVKVLTVQGVWYEVQDGDRRGWVHGNALRLDDAAAGEIQAEMSPRRAKRSRATVARAYLLGPRGGCYYLSGSGRKVYVAKSLCQ